MSNSSQENLPLPLTLEQHILFETRNAAVYLSDIAIDKLTYDEEVTPAEDKLNKVIGDFVLAQFAQHEDVPLTTATPAVDAAAQIWLKEQLDKKLWNARYETRFKQNQSQVEDILQGKVITARHIDGLGYALADGHDLVSGPDSPKEVSGKVVGYDPSESKFWIETHPDLPEFIYEVRIWDYDPYSKELIQTSDITIN